MNFELRFLKKQNGKSILQMREEYDDGGTYWGSWIDVPLVNEEDL